MSMSPDEATQEEWYSQLVDEISRDAIGDFQTERLQSYYLTYRDVAKNGIDRYLEAKALQPTHSTAALVPFTTAAEVGLKSVLLKPVIYGLVHNNAVAGLVAELVMGHMGYKRFEDILGKILKIYGEIELGQFRIEGHAKTLWKELSQLQDARNAVVHRGQPAKPEDVTVVSRPKCNELMMVPSALLAPYHIVRSFDPSASDISPVSTGWP